MKGGGEEGGWAAQGQWSTRNTGEVLGKKVERSLGKRKGVDRASARIPQKVTGCSDEWVHLAVLVVQLWSFRVSRPGLESSWT